MYKAAAEIGELGDNTAALRAAIVDDALLRRAVDVTGQPARRARSHPLGERRHHLRAQRPSGQQRSRSSSRAASWRRTSSPRSTATSTTTPTSASQHDLRIAAPITTDAKVIPALVSRYLAAGGDLAEAFRRTVGSFEGRWRSAVASASDPGTLFLALRGSGQGLYIGLADDSFDRRQRAVRRGRGDERYVRLDGEHGGEIVVVSTPTARARSTASGASPTTAPSCPSSDDDVVTAEVTTRDIDRGDAPHFLLKEITEAPRQLRQDAARQDRRTRRPAARVGRRAGAAAGDRRPPRRRIDHRGSG